MRLTRSTAFFLLLQKNYPSSFAWKHTSRLFHQSARRSNTSTTARSVHPQPTSVQLPSHADSIFSAAIAAVDPVAAVKRHVSCTDGELHVGESVSFRIPDHVVVVAFGKASTAMASAVVDRLSQSRDDDDQTPLKITGCVIDKDGAEPTPEATKILEQHPGIALYTAAHPIPEEHNVIASQHLLRIVADAPNNGALVIACISGGGSALFCTPTIPLDVLREAHSALVESGLSIHDMNRIRRRLETGKGGGLAATVDVALILSDVTGDPLEYIASGPTVGGLPAEGPIESRLMERLPSHLPESVRNILSQPTEAVPMSKCINRLVGNTAAAVHAAAAEAKRLGYNPVILGTELEGEASTVGQMLASMALHQQKSPATTSSIRQRLPVALIAGGETTVTLPKDHGLGGRNQEVALAAAVRLRGTKGIVVGSVGTDGTDGPTDAAGGIVDGSTIKDDVVAETAQHSLDYHDAYNILTSLRRSDGEPALKKTGPTGTNVADVMVALIADGGNSA